MPPSRTPLILQDTVDQLASKLGLNTSSHALILTQAKELLRIVETRARVGILGKIDRHETRAAIVLDHVARQQGMTSLSWSQLGAALGTKACHLEQLQHVLSSYLQPQQTATTITTTTKRTVPREACGSSNPTTTTTTTKRARRTLRSRTIIPSQPSTIHNPNPPNLVTILALKLCIHPHDVAQRAHAVLTKLHQHVTTLPSMTQQRAYQYDLQRYQAAYQAAALYCVEQQQQQQHDHHTHSNNSMIEIADLVQAGSKAFTNLEFRQVLPHVQQVVASMNNNNKNTSSNNNNNHYHHHRAEDKDKLATTSHEDPDTMLMVAYEQWETQILSAVLGQARSELGGDTTTATTVSESDALAHAANRILQRHGLCKDDQDHE